MNFRNLLRGSGRRRAPDRIRILTCERDAARQACAVLKGRLAGAEALTTTQACELLDVRADNAALREARRLLADDTARLVREVDAARADTIEIPIVKVIHALPAGPLRTWTATDNLLLPAAAPRLAVVGGAR